MSSWNRRADGPKSVYSQWYTRQMCLRPLAAAALAVAALMFPAVAAAELVTLTSGRTLSVRAVTPSGSEVILALRGGGEMTCARTLISRIDPDEVPYPEFQDTGTTADPGHSTAAQALGLGSAEQVDAGTVPALYAQAVTDAARRHNVDPKLVHAVITVESRYQPRARSPKGAMGLMQLMPATARELRLRDPYDPVSNIDAGVRYLRQLLDRFELRLALAAYNAGAATVERFGGVPPYPETRSYVARIMRLTGTS